MAVFYNRATLNYNGTTINSNVTQGEIVQTLTAEKSAVNDTYTPGGTVTYVISLVNSGDTDHTDLVIADDLGAYSAAGTTVVPLTYNDGTVMYYAGGVRQADPTVTTDPTSADAAVTFSGITVPANSNGLLIYEATVNGLAPLAEGSTINNTATISGVCIEDDPVVTAAVTAASEARLSIVKDLSPDVVEGCSQVTYTFTIYNSGNAEASDGLVFTDTFDPALSGITVTYNGAAAPATGFYTYDETTGEFATVDGALTVPAAAFSQDIATGQWVTDPGTAVLTITGTI